MADDAICAQLRAELSELVQTEETLDRELYQCFAIIAEGKSLSKGVAYESTDIGHNISKVQQFAPFYEAMVQDSKKLVHQIDECQSLSDRLSMMVRRLDTIQIKAQEALACTEDVLNLKECKIGIQLALEESNLQLAVSYIKQVHDIDEQAAKASDDYGTLQQSEREVKSLVKKEFDEAIERSDIDSVLNLCPLLQVVGLEQDACDTFIDFLEKNVFIGVSADAAPIDGITDHATAYAQTLSSIFNTAFTVFQQYLPVVIQGMEKSRGDVVFIRRLHAVCEKESGVVLKRYMTYKNVRSVMAAVKKSTAEQVAALQHSQTGPLSSKGVSQGESPVPTPAEMHSLLDEIALLLQYCGSYAKYLKMLCDGAEQRDRTGHGLGGEAVVLGGRGRERSMSTVSETESSSHSESRVTVFQTTTDFDRMTDELVNKFYIEGEHWLVVWGIDSVVHSPETLSTEEGGGRMALDGCFFVLQKCSQRAIATGHIHAACATLHLISDHLSTDLLQYYTSVMETSVQAVSVRLKDTMSRFLRSSAWYSGSDMASAGSSSGGFSQGLQSALTLASTLSRNSGMGGSDDAGGVSDGLWGVASHMEKMNDVEACMRYTERLRKDISAAGVTVFGQISPQAHSHQTRGGKADHTISKSSAGSDDAAKLQLCLEDFDCAKESFAQALRVSLGALTTQCQSVMKDVLSKILGREGPAGGIRFELDDDQFEMQPMVQMLPKLILLPFEVLINMCTDTLSGSNKDLMVSMLADTYCSRIEHFMSQSTFSYAGALKLEECIRALNGVFSQASSVSLRSKFSRLREVMLLLTSEMSSPSQTDGSSTASALTRVHNLSQLSEAEAHAFVSLRVDYRG